MSVLIHFSIFPTDKGTSVSPCVAGSLRIIRGSGRPYKLGSISTAGEGGNWEEIRGVVGKCLQKRKGDSEGGCLTLQMDCRGALNGGWG